MGTTAYKPWERIGRTVVFTVFAPLIWLIRKLHITPNMLTVFGLLLNVASAIVLIYGAETADRFQLEYVGWSGLLVLLGGLFDMLDGLIAKSDGKASKFGALFDSVLDRYSELFMFLGILYFLVANHYFISSVITFMALVGSVMVSYTRARAEGLQIPCSGGFMQRPVRVLLIGFASLFTGIISSFWGSYTNFTLLNSQHTLDTIAVLMISILFVAIFSNITAIVRLNSCYTYTQKNQELK